MAQKPAVSEVTGEVFDPTVPEAPTVKQWDFGELQTAIKPEDLLDDWVAALYATGQIIVSDKFVDPETDQPTRGYVVHVVAFKPGGKTGADGLPKEVMFSDPAMPSVFFQMLLKRVCEDSAARGIWYPFRLKRAEANAKGRRPYFPVRVQEIHKDTLMVLCNRYATEYAGLSWDSPLHELTRVVDRQQLEARTTHELESSGGIVDAEVLESPDE
jgi:hypothetical protein